MLDRSKMLSQKMGASNSGAQSGAGSLRQHTVANQRGEPLFSLLSAAPTRICDLGGWTDTWFAGHGTVLNIAIEPEVTVQVEVFPGQVFGAGRVFLDVENYGDRYLVDSQYRLGKHPLLEAALALQKLPDEWSYHVKIASAAPAGAAMGTSAATLVALLGALDALNPDRMDVYQVARTAHRVETEILGQQSGIQDQLAAAFGGINYIEMTNYPAATVTAIDLPQGLHKELEEHLVLVYLGHAHASSQVHEMVIRQLEQTGPDDKRLEDLRQAAIQGRMALLQGDLHAFGACMIANTIAQSNLHAELISPSAEGVIEIARRFEAFGWKVNGAGGDGGSVTILCGRDLEQRWEMEKALKAANQFFCLVPLRINFLGLQVYRKYGKG